MSILQTKIKERNHHMPRVKVHLGDQITLPPEARQKLDVAAGDFLDVEVVAEGVLLKPVPEERHSDIDAEIAEGLADIRARRVTPAFESMEEFEAYRKTDAHKRFIRDGV